MGFMRKNASVFLTVFFLVVILISCFSPKKSTEEENVLNTLTQIQNDLEADITYDQYAGKLMAAKVQVDRLKQSENKNGCFVSAIDKCYASYEIALKAWKQKLDADDEKRKQDMEMTFAFSISFATLNIEKAHNCYR
jgi:phage tail tube protein FII